jgi:hypothetical protein
MSGITDAAVRHLTFSTQFTFAGEYVKFNLWGAFTAELGSHHHLRSALQSGLQERARNGGSLPFGFGEHRLHPDRHSQPELPSGDQRAWAAVQARRRHRLGRMGERRRHVLSQIAEI